MISRDHLMQLIFRIVQCLRIFPLNGPVDGHLAPNHQSHLIGDAQHGFIVRIVREANEIAPPILLPNLKASAHHPRSMLGQRAWEPLHG